MPFSSRWGGIFGRMSKKERKRGCFFQEPGSGRPAPFAMRVGFLICLILVDARCVLAPRTPFYGVCRLGRWFRCDAEFAPNKIVLKLTQNEKVAVAGLYPRFLLYLHSRLYTKVALYSAHAVNWNKCTGYEGPCPRTMEFVGRDKKYDRRSQHICGVRYRLFRVMLINP